MSISGIGDNILQIPAVLQQRQIEENRRLKIEILECNGGEGHRMSADAVQRAVENFFGSQKVECVRYDVGSHLAPDPLNKCSFGKYSMVDLHNGLARRGYTGIIAAMTKVGKIAQRFIFPFNVSQFKKRYTKEKPDLIISAVPLINGSVIKAVKKMNIPVMVISTDADNHMFSYSWPKDKDLGPVRYGIPYNSLSVAKKVDQAVDPKMVRGIGYSLRPGFTKKYTKQELDGFRERHFIKKDEGFVGIMMGGLGGDVTEKYVKTLLKGVDEEKLEKKKERFAVYCGRNNALKSSLKKQLLKSGWKVRLSDEKAIGKKHCKEQIKKLRSFLKKEAITQEMINKLRDGAKVDLLSADHQVNQALQPMKKILDQWVFTESVDANRLQSLIRSYESLLDDLCTYTHKNGVRLSLHGFNTRIHEYMAVANLWVTKPGSSSFNECLFTKTPMLLDGTSRPLDWEALNFELSQTYGFGEKITKFENLFDHLNRMCDPENNAVYQAAEEKYLENRPKQQDFAGNVVHLTKELLKEAEEKKAERAKKQEENQKIKSQKAEAWNKLSGIEKSKAIGSAVFWKMVNIARLIYKKIVGLILWPYHEIAKAFIQYSAFSGFNLSGTKCKTRRASLMKDYKAEPVEGSDRPLVSSVSRRPIDALYIPSQSEKKTGNAVIFVLGKHYQSLHPNNYQHLLEDGSDVVLFNPSKYTIEAMDSDLKELIKELKTRDSDQKLSLSGYCVGAHVAASVASDIAAGNVEGVKAESFPVIVDRGFGDGLEMAQKVTVFNRLPFVARRIDRLYNMYANKKLSNHRGSMLFVSPEQGKDQMLHTKSRNITKEMMEFHKGKHKLVELEGGDHFTPWTIKVHNKVKKFFQKQGIIAGDYRKVTVDDFGGEQAFKKKQQVPWARRKLLPLFV